MKCKVVHHIYDLFYFILNKWYKLSQKIDFLVHLEKFFIYVILHHIRYTPTFCQIKRLMEIHNRGKFH